MHKTFLTPVVNLRHDALVHVKCVSSSWSLVPDAGQTHTGRREQQHQGRYCISTLVFVQQCSLTACIVCCTTTFQFRYIL